MQMTKEEIKMEKNRISAKKSREKQKKKLEDLELLTEKLKAENKRLYDDNEKKNKIISSIQHLFSSKKICKSCIHHIPKEFNHLLSGKVIEDTHEERLTISSSSGPNQLNSFTKFSIFAGILMVVCLVGNMMTIHFKKDTDLSARRNLSQINRYTSFSDEEYNWNIKNSESIKNLNEVISNQIDNPDKKVYFKTYKDLSNRNQDIILRAQEEEQIKEILE